MADKYALKASSLLQYLTHPLDWERRLTSLEAAEKQKNDDNHQSQSQSARGGITPLPAMRPSWQGAYQRENQNHKQYRSKHDSLLFYLSSD
jgi:hypothetical protein